MEVSVVNRQRGSAVDTRGLRRFMERLCVAQPPPRGSGSLTLCLVSDRRMRELNRRFRGFDRPTDVLSFPDGQPPPVTEIATHLGDVVIAVPTALRQAAERGRPAERELRVLALHGYLHLLGHDHETDDGAMMRLQRRLVRRIVDGEVP